MNRRQHVAAARSLIAECGGLEEASSACRVSVPSLSNYQNPRGDAFMPADVLADLEAYAGVNTYSSRLFECAHSAMPSGDLEADTLKLNIHVAGLAERAHDAMKDGILSAGERIVLTAAVSQIREAVNAIDAAVQDERTAKRHSLKVAS